MSPCLCNSLILKINMGSYLLLDQSWSGFKSRCQPAPCLRSVDVFWRSRLWLLDVPQLSAAAMEWVGFVVSAADSEGAPSLLASTESSCMESAASCTALLSSETQRHRGEVWPRFYTERNRIMTSDVEVSHQHTVSCSSCCAACSPSENAYSNKKFMDK